MGRISRQTSINAPISKFRQNTCIIPSNMKDNDIDNSSLSAFVDISGERDKGIARIVFERGGGPHCVKQRIPTRFVMSTSMPCFTM